jgi:deoxycytidylate deaminase
LKTAAAVQAFVKRLMARRRIKDSQLMDIIEYGRMIHAEMAAISDAARSGRSVKDSTMYCTTFPCHLCAKHIVASGINRLVFLEPYPKSYAKKLHGDSITFDPAEKEKVLFQAFIGISPRRYRDIFEKKKRKDAHGRVIPWNEGRPIPRIEDRSGAYIENEGPLAVPALGTLFSDARRK